MGLKRALQAVYLLAASLAFVQGKDVQLCSPCQTSADCGPIGSHTTLPDFVGGLPKGHILAAHFPTLCHHRSCVPLQVPSKDSFCRELNEALRNDEQHRQQQAEKGTHSFTLSKMAHSVAEPVKAHLGGRKAFASRPAARRLTQESDPASGAGTIPAGETATMNSAGTTATQTAVNTNSKGQLSAADTGTGSSVIYVPGIGYVTPVNSDGTTASPAAPAKGMAHLPMYGSPATQGSSPATGGVTTQSGGQASAKTGTKKPTGDAGTNAASTQVPASENAAGEAGANGGTNSGTDLSDGSQSSTATGSAAGLSNSQGSGSTSSGSKATGSGASDSAGSESGTAREGAVGSIGTVSGGQPTKKEGRYQSGSSGERGGAAGTTGDAATAGGAAEGASASGSAKGSAGGTATKGAGASGSAGEGASASGKAGSGSASGSATGATGGTATKGAGGAGSAGEGTSASGSGKAGSSGSGTASGSGSGASGTGKAMGGAVGTINGGQPTAVQGTYGTGRSVSGGQASTAGGGTNGGSSTSGSGSAGGASGGSASTTGSGSGGGSGSGSSSGGSAASGSGSSGGDQFSGQNAANQAGANLGTFNSQFGGGSSSNGGGRQQGASVTGSSAFGSGNTGGGTRGASAQARPAPGPAGSVAADTNSFMVTSQAANSQGLNPDTSTSTAPNTLQYSNGFVSFKADSDQVIPHTHNAAQCAQHCARSPDCVAWTRVAGGSKDVQTCYLKTSLDGAADTHPGGTTTMTQSGGAVQYSQPGTGNRQILESGTKDPKALPAALYGCPYPATSGGECKPPPSCNCYQGVCYGSCQ